MTPSSPVTWIRCTAGFPLLFLIIVGVDYFATGIWSAQTLVVAAIMSVLAPLLLNVIIRSLIKAASSGRSR